MTNHSPDLLALSLRLADELTTTEELDQAVAGDTAEDQTLPCQLLDIAHIADYYRQVHTPLLFAKKSGSPQNWSHLELEEILGQGKHGVVYRALDPHLMREVALKVLPLDSQADQAQALAEARRLASLKHANIVTIFGAEIWQGQAGFWMELITGHTLEDLITTHGPLGPHEAARIGSDLANALTAIHGAGLVHRDIKPANVMREYGGRTILMDLGTGTALPEIKPESQALSPCGTPMYCAPEVLAGQPAQARTDLYSLGVLLDHLVTGSYPITGHSLAEIKVAQQNGRTKPLAERRHDLDGEFIRIVEKATQLDPDHRYQGAGDLSQDLNRWLASTTTSHPSPADTSPPLQKPPQRTRTLLGMALGLLLVGTLAWHWFQPAPLPNIQADATFFLGSTQPPRSLSPGALVQPGDKLFLNFTTNQALHVYLINEDDEGRAYILFPLPGLDLENPLPAGSHRLPPPREGVPNSWLVSSTGGQEHFLLAASPAPIACLEDLIQEIPAASGDEVLSRQAYALSPQLRGVGALLPDRQALNKDQEPRIIAGIKEALRRDEVRGKAKIWFQQIDLANPR